MTVDSNESVIFSLHSLLKLDSDAVYEEKVYLGGIAKKQHILLLFVGGTKIQRHVVGWAKTNMLLQGLPVWEGCTHQQNVHGIFQSPTGRQILVYRWTTWLERELTDRKISGSKPTSPSRLPLSRLGQPDSIPALVLPSGGMAARHRKGVTAERFSLVSRPGSRLSSVSNTGGT
ncbi:hypothetical protein CSKR_107239 [Clonorchis sinensis]|uniref:Uncharacterized protein n=1 Tax=Clonorchis sinensis TaxID=79923 RepID=A0A3R7FJD1_CLOSI|nr:hypothetical protein CSKR_107239 [Clonorchis sinensis]